MPADSTSKHPDIRVDPNLGTTVHVVGHRQSRPNLTTNNAPGECPFCVGGQEAPEPYEVRSFVNRWPAMADERCEVVLYSSDHHASFSTLSVDAAAQVIDLWAQRTIALSARPDVHYVLIFENRGAEVGATISHPHGQIYAYDHVPDRPQRLFAAPWKPDTAESRKVNTTPLWSCVVPYASQYPTAVTIAPVQRTNDLASLSSEQRRGLAEILIDTLSRLDRLYDTPLPYMMWINQRPSQATHDDAWMNIEIVSPWRQSGLSRFIAAAEVGAGEYFNPVVPEELAEKLRRLSR